MTTTLRVLHIEDQVRDVALISRHLSRAGYELVSDRVETPDAMKEALETHEWDIILCDYSMPHFNALQALDLMKEIGMDIPFIIISGSIGEAAAVEAMRAGAHDYLMKDSLARLAPAIERELSEAENRRARREAEEALLTSEQKYRLLFDNNPLPMWVFDRETLRFLATNEAAIAHYGFSREEFLAMTLEDIRPAEELPRLFHVLSLPEEGLKRTGIWKHRKKDGTILDVEIISHPLNFGGRSAVLTLANDVTEKIRAQEQLRLQGAALESAANAIVITDRDGKILWINSAFTKTTGYSSEQVQGRNPRLLKSGRQDREFYREMWDTILSGKVWRNTIINRHKDGTLNHEDLTITPIPDASGAITHFVGIKQDIGGRIKAEETLRSKNEELASMTQQLWQASKLATMGELAASIAHELNNPLATVALRTENLLMRLPKDSAQRKPLEIITQEVDRMAVLVNNLLQFSRRSHRQISTVDPREEIANSLELVHYHLRTRKIEVLREFAGELPTIQADRQQLRQVFLNLLTNASDAMPDGGKLTVRVALDGSSAAAVALEFADSGKGIAAENLERIWDPFFTTKPEGKGTGLGLAICRRIVEEHGGTIDIQSQPGQGTTVRMILPATGDGALI